MTRELERKKAITFTAYLSEANEDHCGGKYVETGNTPAEAIEFVLTAARVDLEALEAMCEPVRFNRPTRPLPPIAQEILNPSQALANPMPPPPGAKRKSRMALENALLTCAKCFHLKGRHKGGKGQCCKKECLCNSFLPA